MLDLLLSILGGSTSHRVCKALWEGFRCHSNFLFVYMHTNRPVTRSKYNVQSVPCIQCVLNPKEVRINW